MNSLVKIESILGHYNYITVDNQISFHLEGDVLIVEDYTIELMNDDTFLLINNNTFNEGRIIQGQDTLLSTLFLLLSQ